MRKVETVLSRRRSEHFFVVSVQDVPTVTQVTGRHGVAVVQVCHDYGGRPLVGAVVGCLLHHLLAVLAREVLLVKTGQLFAKPP